MHNPQWKWELFPIPPDLRRSADAVSDGKIVYLRQAEKATIYQFDIQTGQQAFSPVDCKYLRCSMVMIHNTVVTVGGAASKDKTVPRSDELLSFNPGSSQWEEVLPRMPTKRSRTTALTHGRLIIVIGGEDENHTILTRVEILDTETNIWYRGIDLPEPRCCSSGTIVNDTIYILGGWRGDDPVSSVLACSVDLLINSCKPATQHWQEESSTIWKPLPNLPVQEAACTSFHNTLLVIGGRANKEPVSEIRIYNPYSQRWEVIGYMTRPRYICFAIGLMDRLIIIGGRTGTTNTEDTMEIFHPLPQT